MGDLAVGITLEEFYRRKKSKGEKNP